MEQPKKGQVVYLPIPKARLANPYRPQSKKHACFEIFLRGGTRESLIAQMEATGATGYTVRTWLSGFKAYSRGVAETKAAWSD
jgi:hypothetical protein